MSYIVLICIAISVTYLHDPVHVDFALSLDLVASGLKSSVSCLHKHGAIGVPYLISSQDN